MKKIISITVLAIVCALCCVLGLVACNSHTHNYWWAHDEQYHWRTCIFADEGCDAPIIDKELHSYDKGGLCICGFRNDKDMHSLTLVPAKASTCTENGNTAYYICSHCDLWFSDAEGRNEIFDKSSVILPKHNYVNGECVVCHQKQPTEGLWYEINEDGETASLVHASIGNDVTQLVIASEYDGKPVTRISEGSCDNRLFTSVIIPDSVIEIGKSAFAGCENLANITFGSGISVIGAGAFGGCTSLTSLTIPDSVTEIGGQAFSGCENIAGVTFGSGVSVIGNSVFEYCTSLTEITIPDTVTEIGYNAFGNCSSLESVSIGSGITILRQMFYDCPSLTTVTLSEGLEIIDQLAFNAMNLSSIIIPNSVTEIGSSAFAMCYNLTSVTIGNQVKTIGNVAFWDCSLLTNIVIPNSVETIGDSAFNWSGLTSVDLGNGVKTIGENAFGGTKITSLTIPDSVENIGISAFGSTGLTSITIPSGVKTIGKSAFGYCSELETVYWNAVSCGLATITGSSNKVEDLTIFDACPKLTTLVIGASVQRIGNYAFNGCVNLTDAIIPDSVEDIGSYAFYQCTGLNNVTIGKNIKYIRHGAFDGCTSLKGVIIPDSVKLIDMYAFSGCSSLTYVVIGSGVTEIGNSAFYNTSDSNKLETIYYKGTAADWANIEIGTSWNAILQDDSIRYYYSETRPAVGGNYWYYDTDGVTPVKW